MPETHLTAAQYREVQGEVYGTYVAAGPIFIDGARAFNEGDAVPVSHVERGIVRQDDVLKVTSKSGREAVAASAAPTENPKG